MSISEANKMLRVLTGERLKYTVRIVKPDDHIIEFQSNNIPDVKWHDDLRQPWLYATYNQPIMRWIEGSILIVEENPKA